MTSSASVNSLSKLLLNIKIAILTLAILQVLSPDDFSFFCALDLIIYVPIPSSSLSDCSCIYNSWKFGHTICDVIQWIYNPTA